MRNLLVIVVIIISTHLTFGQKYLKYYKKGVKLYKQEKYLEADSIFSIAITKKPSSDKNPNVFFDRGVTRLYLSDTCGFCSDMLSAIKYYDYEAEVLYKRYCSKCSEEEYYLLQNSISKIKESHVESMTDFVLFSLLLCELNSNLKLELDIDVYNEEIIVDKNRIENNNNCTDKFLSIFTQIKPEIISKLSLLDIPISYDLYLSDYLVSSIEFNAWVMLQDDLNNLMKSIAYNSISVLRNKKGKYNVSKLTESNETLKVGDEIIKVNGTPSEYIGFGLFNKILISKTDDIIFTISRDTLNVAFHFPEMINKLNEFDYKLINNNTCYLDVNSFLNADFTTRVKNKIEIDKKEIDKIIIDLRGCLGGTLDEMANFADLFLKKEIIIAEIKSRNNLYNITFISEKEELISDAQIIVLIDNWTSSGAEIVAGIIQKTGRGILIGEKTSASGNIQKVFPFLNYSIKLTVAELFIGKDQNVERSSVIPDYEILNTDLNVDEVLNFAIDL